MKNPPDPICQAPANDIHRVLRPEFVRQIRRVYACGPRVVAELLLEVANRDALDLRLPVYAALNPALVAALDCRGFPDSVLAEVPDELEEDGAAGRILAGIAHVADEGESAA